MTRVEAKLRESAYHLQDREAYSELLLNRDENKKVFDATLLSSDQGSQGQSKMETISHGRTGNEEEGSLEVSQGVKVHNDWIQLKWTEFFVQYESLNDILTKSTQLLDTAKELDIVMVNKILNYIYICIYIYI